MSRVLTEVTFGSPLVVVPVISTNEAFFPKSTGRIIEGLLASLPTSFAF